MDTKQYFELKSMIYTLSSYFPELRSFLHFCVLILGQWTEKWIQNAQDEATTSLVAGGSR
jgi:hypothetical protein